MKIRIETNTVFLSKEEGDPRIRTESQLMHHLRLAMLAQHFDVIKKEMCKDGHMVSDKVYYVRDRKWRFGIYDEAYAIRDVVKEYNNRGTCDLDWVDFE